MKNIKYKDGEPCKHRGCLNHRTHPCEGCGRINGKGIVCYEDDSLLDYTIMDFTI